MRIRCLLALSAGLLLFPLRLVASELPVIAVIGTGDMGDSVGPRLADIGYQVVYGSRNPASDKVQNLLNKSPENVGAKSQSAAAQMADIVLLLVPWPPMETVAQNLGNMDGKVLIDASIPYKFAADGYLEISVDTSSSELIQGWNPAADVVKVGFPGSFLIDNPLLMKERPSALIAGDNKYAKEQTATLINALGLKPLDAGPLRNARHIESMGLLYMVPLLQGRERGWEFFVRESNYWPCLLKGEPLYGANAKSPEKMTLPTPTSATTTELCEAH